ncbi:hypothetical protein NPIL_468101 [Nephila pilipes]|uniref:Uncharacterized protein n=1 Tax=Nephila pilipes TaxID=299642 RepID=A0A8X6NYS9_NEPPI|nr:hypothetical protein NPIL_468101 [Nephila pilipes]
MVRCTALQRRCRRTALVESVTSSNMAEGMACVGYNARRQKRTAQSEERLVVVGEAEIVSDALSVAKNGEEQVHAGTTQRQHSTLNSAVAKICQIVTRARQYTAIKADSYALLYTADQLRTLYVMWRAGTTRGGSPYVGR